MEKRKLICAKCLWFWLLLVGVEMTTKRVYNLLAAVRADNQAGNYRRLKGEAGLPAEG